MIKSPIKSPIKSGIKSVIGDIPRAKQVRWIMSSNAFVIADNNGRIIKAGR